MAFELTPTIRFWLNFAHPVTMWVLLALSLYAAYLGLQVQRTRNAQGEDRRGEWKDGKRTRWLDQ